MDGGESMHLPSRGKWRICLNFRRKKHLWRFLWVQFQDPKVFVLVGRASLKEELPPSDASPAACDATPDAPSCAVPMASLSTNPDEMGLTFAQTATARSLFCRSVALIVCTVISMFSPAVYIVIPIDAVLNILVASLVIHWTKRENIPLITKMESRRWGFRAVYRLSIIAAMVTACCMVLRYGLIYSVRLATGGQSYKGVIVYLLFSFFSWFASIFCILLLALIASDSAPTTGFVSLTSPEGALISKEQQERDTREGKPMNYCCSLALSRATCCIFFVLGFLIPIFLNANTLDSYVRRASLGGQFGYICETHAATQSDSTCFCLTETQVNNKNLLCQGSDTSGCFTQDQILCPTVYRSDSELTFDELKQAWQPFCIVDSNCFSSDSFPSRLGLRGRPCQIQSCETRDLLYYS